VKKLYLAYLALATSALANTFYVATTGNDGNPGTAALPWATLQHAVETIAPGDTIQVQAGTYVGCRIENSGTAALPKTLMAAPGAQVIVNAAGPKNKHSSNIEVENFSGTVSYWIIDGLESANSLKYGIDVRITDHITVRNCYVHNSAVTGIFTAFSNFPLIENNQSASNGEHGVYHSNSGDNPTIRGNNLHHNANAGIHMNGDITQGGDGQISFATVEKNVIWENGRGGASGINCDGVDSSIFRNNLLYNNHASGISLYAIDGAHGSSNNKVYNNTIVMAAGARWVINIPKSSKGKASPVGNKIFNNILYTPDAAKGSVLTYSSTVAGFESDYNVVVNRFSANGGKTIVPLTTWQGFGYDGTPSSPRRPIYL
jgi:parallel beta-helix repeat protein